MPTDTRIRFDVFEARRDTGELFKHGVRLKLEDQPFAVLMALLENPGAMVTRADLRARIWPEGTFVDFDRSLTKAVNKVRTALGDTASQPRFIETLSRRGYRFIAEVSAAPDTALETRDGRAGGAVFERRISPISTVTALLCAVAAGLSFQGMRHDAAASPTGIQSVAVLPFQNLTGDPGQEYFADGLTDDLISNLARIGPLRVVSFTTAIRYKTTRKSLPEISRELSADAAIEGSVQRLAGRVRINVKLIRAPIDRQIWSDSYEADAAESGQLGARATLDIAHQISARLTAEAAARLAGGGPAKSRAYEAYLHGRYLWNLRGKEAISGAARYFEEAVAEDPGFALAWSGLADTYTIGWGSTYDPELAERYARKAVALGPGLAETHVSLGFALYCRRRFAEAETELKRGIELNPNYVAARQLYSVFLLTVGRSEEALSVNEVALRLDPFSLPVNNIRGIILVSLRKYERAEKQFRAVATIDPTHADVHRSLARIYWLQQRGAEAIAAERRAAELTSGQEGERLLRAQDQVETAFTKFGLHEACVRSAEPKKSSDLESQQWLLLEYGILRDKEQLLGLLEIIAPAMHYGTMLLLKTSPEFDFLRSDRRFQDALKRLGLLT